MKITAMLKTRKSSLLRSHLYAQRHHLYAQRHHLYAQRRQWGREQLCWAVCLKTGRSNQELGTRRITGLSLYVCGD